MQKAIDVIVNCQSMEELLALHWALALSQDSPVATARCNSPGLTPQGEWGMGPEPEPGCCGVRGHQFIAVRTFWYPSNFCSAAQLSALSPLRHIRQRQRQQQSEMKWENRGKKRILKWSCRVSQNEARCWWWHVASVVDSKFSWKSNNFLPKSQCVGVWICVCGCVCVCEVCFHLSHSSLAQATRRAAHTSNYANQAAAKGAGSMAWWRAREEGGSQRNRLLLSRKSKAAWKAHRKSNLNWQWRRGSEATSSDECIERGHPSERESFMRPMPKSRQRKMNCEIKRDSSRNGEETDRDGERVRYR